FDDCGFGWFAYDFAAAVSFIEDDPLIPALKDAWLGGYSGVAPLADVDRAKIDRFILLRRLLITAGLASHAETPTAKEFSAAYADRTVALAEQFLRSAG
ncbi:MAG: aminoglycoside phosphotransferase, partial [Pseudomonadota bacterium]